MSTQAAVRAVPVLLLSLLLGSAQQPTPSQKTLFVMCETDGPQHVLSPVFPSQNQAWRAYIEVDVRSGCSHTTRLWIGHPDGTYRVAFLIPSRPSATGNGMEVLGWSLRSNLILVRTEQWQYGSDAGDTQGVLAIDPETGMVREVDLDAILKEKKNKRCLYRVSDAGFAEDSDRIILVRAQLSTAIEPPDTEEDIPVAERCGNSEETWSFDLITGEKKQVDNSVPLQLFRSSLPPVA